MACTKRCALSTEGLLKLSKQPRSRALMCDRTALSQESRNIETTAKEKSLTGAKQFCVTCEMLARPRSDTREFDYFDPATAILLAVVNESMPSS